MNDFQEYNSLLPSIIGDENLKNNIAQEANAEAERKKQEITEPFNLVGSELLKSEIDKGLKSGVSKLQKGLVKQGQQVGQRVAKAVGDKVSQATGVDVSNVATKLGKGDLSGALDEGSKAVSKAVGDKVSQAQNVIDDVKGKGEDLISKGKNVLGDTEKLGKNEISNRINNLDDDLKNKVLQKLGNHSDKVVKQNLSTEDQEESMRAKAQELMNKGEKAQAKRDSGDDKPEPPKQEEEEDDDDEMPPLEDQEGNKLPPEQQAQPDQEAQDLYDRIKSNLEGDTTGEATEENQAPTSSKPSNEPDFSEDFEDQPQGLLDKMLGKQPKSKYVGTDQDPEDELQTKADQAQQKAESQALKDKYNPAKNIEEDSTPSIEENPFLFDKSLLSETNTTSAEASENFVKSLTSSKDYIPPSQQTGGQDATQLEDDAGYNRGQQKIPAKVDPKDDDDDFDETGTEENPFPPPKVEDLLETKSPLTQTESLTAEPAQPPPPAPPPAPAPPPEPAPQPLQQSESLTAEPASNEISQADQLAKNVSNVSDDVESGLDTAENVGSSALKATETTTQELADTTAASTAGDENPIGDIITAGIGLATLISPLFSSPHKVLPTQYLNPSSQFGA